MTPYIKTVLSGEPERYNTKIFLFIHYSFMIPCPYIRHGSVFGDSVKEKDSQLFAEEGISVDLACSYSTSFSTTYNLYWYRQYTYGGPEYILFKANQGSLKNTAPFAEKKFQSEVKTNSTTLTITNVKPEDSATYRCALQRAQCNSDKENSYTNPTG
ncbi:hypothetical protein XELAEV_18007253mg [Xenopus laevis]|uniref:Ig-like domain-containing protein n=1 Tax=Xenopus laevis TaxID=8355 RepID=A0A974I569_XENLA|nr:hypothetical protein XELAEV_18007253mg [Xenopus laevis]